MVKDYAYMFPSGPLVKENVWSNDNVVYFMAMMLKENAGLPSWMNLKDIYKNLGGGSNAAVVGIKKMTGS